MSDNIIDVIVNSQLPEAYELNYCTTDGITVKVEVYANLYFENVHSYPVHSRQGLVTHELGHGGSVGHVREDYPIWGIMKPSQNLSNLEVNYRPVFPDFELLNQAYP